MRGSLGGGADVGAWTRRYPWAMLGASVAAGFVVVAALWPGRRRAHEEEHEPALLERILADEKIAERLKELAAEDESRPSRAGTLQSVAGSLWKTFGPAVQSAVATALASHVAQEQERESNPHDGHSGEEPPGGEPHDTPEAR